MAVDYRRAGGRVYYEGGAAIEFAYPDFDSPTSRLTFLRNPSYGRPHETDTLAQSLTETAARKVTVASTASGTARRMEYSWGAMPEGWTQGQRLSGTATLRADTTSNVSGSTDYEVALGFRSFDGSAPTALELQELNAVDSVLATHAITPAGRELEVYTQGVLRRLTVAFTSDASVAKFRLVAQSAGEDFLVADVHLLQADGTDSYSAGDFQADTDSDGVADAWALAAGSASNCSHYAEDAAGLREWIRDISEGGLNTFEVRRPGDGVVLTVRLVRPLERVGWPRLSSGVVEGVGVELLEV